MMARELLLETARQVYRSYGFSPIETPALEAAEILLGKGGGETEKQLFRFTDQGNRDVAMRFDLTIPFARFSAQHLQEIGIPFRRYHMGTVWRAEKPQKGRYREFMQCDFDTIGTESNLADIETLLVIHDLMAGLGFERFTICVSHRKVLTGLLEQLELADRSQDMLRALDKLGKIGRERVLAEMAGDDEALQTRAGRLLDLAGMEGTPESIFARLEELLAGNETGTDGVARLRELMTAAHTAGIPTERIRLDLSIARGLDYYTGTIYETFLDDLPEIGSVCSGGRYDNLAGLFTSQPLPGVGASLGLDRLLAAMQELDMIPEASTPADVLITVFDTARQGEYLKLGRELRAAGLAAEVFPDGRKLGKQMQYASRRGFRFAVIGGEEEFAAGCWQLKDLAGRTQESIPAGELAGRLQALLSEAGPEESHTPPAG
ncbi:MAG: histidine--tRNA ligase [Planctomycetaceae bacterium]|nr:histidine--tRNA ligase [Planctomycetaceae bacterium]